MPSRFDKELTKKNIALMLERIRTEEDPQVLNEYRALFKKEVSLFRRSWVTAYLLMLFDKGALGRGDKTKNRRSGEGRFRSPRAEDGSGENQRMPPPSVAVLIPEDESKRLFMSVGRNRRVFPREILGLITARTSVPREDIGAIRILDNYSFVQVRDTAAEAIIEALNGHSFRGRTLSVNYAKSRRDDDPGTLDESRPDEASGDDFETPEAGDSEQTQDHSDKEDI
jgi:hypothetical protein